MARKIALVLAGFMLLLVGAGAGGVMWLRTSLPRTTETVELAGLSGRVRVIRDANAVPHIFAQDANGAYFALGYVHAQDRLWQMEFMRRLPPDKIWCPHR